MSRDARVAATAALQAKSGNVGICNDCLAVAAHLLHGQRYMRCVFLKSKLELGFEMETGRRLTSIGTRLPSISPNRISSQRNKLLFAHTL